MAKYILLFFFLQFIFTGLEGKIPSILCGLAGKTRADVTYKFSEDIIPKLPDRCEVIIYDGYIHSDDGVDPDIGNMKMLTSKGKIIYTFINYFGNVSWDVFINESPPNIYEEQMKALTTFISDTKISGIILDMLFLFDDTISDHACKLNGFICKIKEKCPGLVVGIVVSGMDYPKYSQKIFDFTLSNEHVDFYYVDTFTIGARSCSANTSSMSSLPLTVKDTGGNQDIISLESVTTAVEQSGMDKSKLVLNFVLETRTSDGSFSYTEYCSRGNVATLWCADSVPTCYKQGAAAKSQNYDGISITYLDLDDYSGCCNCGYFPVTNAFIDGFQSKSEPCCAAIDNQTPSDDGSKGGGK